MKEDATDPLKETMIAALYGELTPDEERAFRDRLAGDPALRAEFEELETTRKVLADWALEDPPPGFVFVDPVPGTGEGREGLVGWLARRLRAPIPAWGFATSTVALLVLVLSGFRVDWVDGGVTAHFGRDVRTQAAAEGPAAPDPLPAPATGGLVRPVSQQGIPVTREDMDMYSSGVARLMTNVLQSYQEKRDAEMMYILQRFYEQVRFERQREFEELRSQMEGMGLGLLAEQTMTNAALKGLIEERGRKPVRLSPYEDTPLKPNGNEDEKND